MKVMSHFSPFFPYLLAALTACLSLSCSHTPGNPGPYEPAPVGSIVPNDYSLQFQSDFSRPNALQDFTFSDSSAWRIGSDNGQPVLELHRQSDYQPKVRSPFNIALLKNLRFSDFILEVEMRQTGREYGHRDMCLFYDFTTPSQFYYTHIASAADAHAHNIFIVNEAPRTAIADKTSQGIDWGHEWHQIRIERDASLGTIKVYFDDLSSPLMTGSDKTFLSGHIGFGSFDDTGMVRNIRIWAPEAEQAPAPAFP